MSSQPPHREESPTPEEKAPHAELAEHADLIRKLGKRVVADVIEIGRRLSECKQLLGHGHWLPWIEREFHWSERTARNFIRAYDLAQSKSENFADLTLDVSSLYLLAAPSTPAEARDEVLRRSEGGEDLPHAEVKRIVREARETEAPQATAKRPVSASKFVRTAFHDLWRLPPVEQMKVFQGPRQYLDLRIADATIRQQWPRPYRELQDALDALEITEKRSKNKIIAAIPADHYADTAARVERAKDFLIKLCDKLKQENDVIPTRGADDRARLAELLNEARKSDNKRYGRPNQARVVEAIWSELNPAQIALLRSGRYGSVIKATVDRLILAHKTTEV